MTPASEIKPPAPPRPWLQGRVRMSKPALGEVYARGGIAWGRLLDRHRRGNPAGTVDVKRQGERA